MSVGFVRDVKRGQVNGQDVMLGTLVITDAQTIEEIENGEHTDLSCGYDCDIIDEANPQQRNIRGNHVALCQQGRAGIARIVDSVKDYKPQFAIWVKKNGRWLIWGGSESSSIDKQAYLREGYEDVKVVKNGEEVKDSIKDAEMIKVNGVNMIVAKSKEEIPERTHFKQEVQYNGKAYYWHEGFDTKRNYLVPIKDSSFEELAQKEYDKLKKDLKALEAEIDRNDNNPNYNMKNAIDRLDEIQNKIYKLKQQFSSTLHDDLIHNYTKQDLDLAQEMLANASSDKEKELLQGLITDIKFELNSQQFEDKLVESSSLQDAIKKVKDNFYGGIKESILRQSNDFILKRLFAELDDLKKQPISIKKENDIYDVKQQLEARVKQIKREFVEDKLVESGSEEAFKKNIATEIRSGKDPKQAAAIAYSVKRKHDSKKYEISYVEDDIEHIHVVKASSLQDAIKKVKDRLAPSQYAALKKLGVSSNTYKNWTSEQASKYIAQRKGQTTKTNNTTKTSENSSQQRINNYANGNKKKLEQLLSKYEKLSGKPLDLAEKINVYKSSWYTSAKAKFKTQAEAKRFASAMHELGEDVSLDQLNKTVAVRSYFDEDDKSTKIARNILNEFHLNPDLHSIVPSDDDLSRINMYGVDRKIKNEIVERLDKYGLDPYITKYGEIAFTKSKENN